MTPDEINKWCDLICEGFTENEIEHLENCADYCFERVERGIRVELTGDLILDTLSQYDEGSEDE